MTDKENNKVVVSINGQKVADNNNLPDLTSQLPDEVANLLAKMQNPAMDPNLTLQLSNISKEEKVTNSISDTSPNLSDEVKKEINNVTQNHTAGLAMVRSQSEEIKLAMERKKALEEAQNSKDKNLMIHENGVAMGIVVGVSTRQDVINKMKLYSKQVYDSNDMFYFYDDITVTIIFDDLDETVKEIKFGEKYKGSTSKGLKIGDSVEKAVELYGSPRMKSPKGAIWNKFAIFCDQMGIISIRIQK